MAEAIMFWATPAFFVLIGIELVAAPVMGRAVYRANDAIASLSLGVSGRWTACSPRRSPSASTPWPWSTSRCSNSPPTARGCGSPGF